MLSKYNVLRISLNKGMDKNISWILFKYMF